MSARLDEHLRATVQTSRHAVRTGPFTVMLDPRDDAVARNYAVPDAAARPSPADVQSLVAVFRDADRRPALEVVPSSAPAVMPALHAAGFGTDATLALMVAAPSDARDVPVPDGAEVALVDDRDDLDAAATVQHAAYGAPPPERPDVDRLSDVVAAGGRICLARVHGAPVGAGLLTAPRREAAELAAVATDTAWRRRGIAARVSATLLAAGPPLTYLMAYEEEASIYERVGFRRWGELVFCSAPAE